MALEMARRYVLATSHAVPLFRTLVWVVILGALPVTALLAASVFTGCYGRTCADLARFMLTFMFVCCLLCLPLIPFGYSLLQKATWAAS